MEVTTEAITEAKTEAATEAAMGRPPSPQTVVQLPNFPKHASREVARMLSSQPFTGAGASKRALPLFFSRKRQLSAAIRATR